jgi:hypothetical protein
MSDQPRWEAALTAPFTREEFLERAPEHERAAEVGLSVGPNVNYVRTFQACAAALRIAASVMLDSRKGKPKEIVSDWRVASMRQIHIAIELLHRSELEAAMSVASAAEGVLPEPSKPYLRLKEQAAVEALPKDSKGALGINDFANWTKHGEVNHQRVERARLSELEVINMIVRAISKFIALYDEKTQQMSEFNEWATKRLPVS